MKKFLRCLFLFCLIFNQLQSSLSDCSRSRGHTQNDLIPNFTLGVIPRSITDEAAVSFFGEVGRRNYRANGTFGVLWGEDDRVKLSGEFLTQKLGYRFSTGREERWMHQYAVGVEYQHDFCNAFLPSADVGFYCSYAPARKLGHKECRDFLYSRRIAGSNSYGGSLGTTLIPWCSGYFHVDADYDFVKYNRKYKSRKVVSGFGGSFTYHQDLKYNLFFDLLGEFKRPYNYGRVRLGWHHPDWSGLVVGLFGAHTRGKSHLPSNTTAGLELTYVFGDRADSRNECTPCYCEPILAAWVSSPAVYMPQVLAVAEEKKRRLGPCQILVSNPIPNANFTGTELYTLNISPYFSDPSGAALVFSAEGLPPEATFDPTTGVIFGVGLNDNNSYTVTIRATAADACSVAIQSFTISFPCTTLVSTTIPPASFTGIGNYSLDVSSHFTNPSGLPLVYSAVGLPAGSTIDASTGVISGSILSDTLTYNVVVTATSADACASVSEPFTITFPCIPPSVLPIPPINIGALSGTPYTLDMSVYFVSPGGQPFTYSATGLPPGSTIDPTTGVISGVSVGSGPVFIISISGTTVCGTVTTNFQLTFNSA